MLYVFVKKKREGGGGGEPERGRKDHYLFQDRTDEPKNGKKKNYRNGRNRMVRYGR